MVVSVPDDLLEFGLPQRDWQSRLLPESLAPQRLRILINASNTSANPTLPMPLARAANLFMNGLLLMGSFLPIDSQSSYFTRTFPNVTIETNKVGSAAIMADALPPPTFAADEQRQLRWFLNQSQALFTRHAKSPQTIKELQNVALEFLHVAIAPSIEFDVVTCEIEVSQSSTTSMQCGPWPALCLFPKRAMTNFASEDLYDPRTQVQALAICVNGTGDETLSVTASYYDDDLTPPTTVAVHCPSKSNSSLLMVSVAKRLVADTLVQHPLGMNATATNVRKVYSFTVGSVFHAACATTSGCCLGLRVGLSDPPRNTTANSNRQAWSFGSGYGNHCSQPLVRAHKPPRPRRQNMGYDEMACPTTSCDALVEDRPQLVLKYHVYMEESLQPAYTAATFFLLQNAVVKDTITLNAGQLSLNFDGNRRDMAVRLSVPALNAWLTLVGCALLVVCTVVAVVWSAMLQHRNLRDPLRGNTTPHAIARVALDESRFPPLLLKRRVADAGERVDIEQLDVQSIAVTRPLVELPPPTHII